MDLVVMARIVLGTIAAGHIGYRDIAVPAVMCYASISVRPNALAKQAAVFYDFTVVNGPSVRMHN